MSSRGAQPARDLAPEPNIHKLSRVIVQLVRDPALPSGSPGPSSFPNLSTVYIELALRKLKLRNAVAISQNDRFSAGFVGERKQFTKKRTAEEAETPRVPA